jgi:hypothetical protein
MGLDTDQIRVAANGKVWVGAVGSAEPTSPTATPSGAWTDLGAIDENGVTDTDGKTIVDILIWQSFYPARKVVSQKDTKITFSLRQWDADNVIFAFGGGSVVGGKYTPPQPEEINESALMLDWVDGLVNYRWIYRRGIVADPVTSTFKRAAAADLSIGYALLGPPVGVTDAWIMLTDDATFGS